MHHLLLPDHSDLILLLIANGSTLLVSTVNVIISHYNSKQAAIISSNVNGHLDALRKKLFAALDELSKVNKK